MYTNATLGRSQDEERDARHEANSQEVAATFTNDDSEPVLHIHYYSLILPRNPSELDGMPSQNHSQ